MVTSTFLPTMMDCGRLATSEEERSAIAQTEEKDLFAGFKFH